MSIDTHPPWGTIGKALITPKEVPKEEDLQERKSKMFRILDYTINIFEDNLKQGKVKIKSTQDLERIVKMILLISGEPDSIVKQDTDITMENVNTEQIEVVREMLQNGDPAILAIKERLLSIQNTQNDE